MAEKRRAAKETDKTCQNSSQLKYLKLNTERKIHPLMIDHIQDKIFSYILPTWNNKEILQIPPTFKPLRLVCRQWNNAINSILFKKFAAKELCFGDNNCNKIKKFCQSWSHSSNPIPFSKFRFEVNFFVKENESHFQNFLTASNILSSLRELELIFGTNFTMDLANFQELLEPSNLNFEGLKVLKFQTSYVNTNTSHRVWKDLNMIEESQEDEDLVPKLSAERQILGLLNLLKAFLNSAVDLEEFVFYNPTQHQSTGLNSLGTKFGKLVAELVPEKVKILKMVTEIEEEDLELLTEKGLKLETLHLNFYGKPTTEAAVLNFLKSQTSTLKEFNVADMESYRSSQFWDFPIFPKLELLEIKGNMTTDFRFVQSFPNLKKLTFRLFQQGFRENLEILENIQVIHPTLESIELPKYPVTPGLISTISSTFTNLKSLKLCITKETLGTLEMVFEKLQTLSMLELSFSEFFENIQLDSAFTGFPNEVCARGVRACEDFLGIRNPSLANFKNLEQFTIKSTSYAVVITDVTVSYALLRLPKLKKVVMQRHSISQQYLDLLMEKCELEIPKGFKEDLSLPNGSWGIMDLLS